MDACKHVHRADIVKHISLACVLCTASACTRCRPQAALHGPSHMGPRLLQTTMISQQCGKESLRFIYIEDSDAQPNTVDGVNSDCCWCNRIEITAEHTVHSTRQATICVLRQIYVTLVSFYAEDCVVNLKS